jgi:hypothetical protein
VVTREGVPSNLRVSLIKKIAERHTKGLLLFRNVFLVMQLHAYEAWPGFWGSEQSRKEASSLFLMHFAFR